MSPAPLLERDEPLTSLARALSLSRAHGQIAAVAGEAGVGKTALVEAFAARHAKDARFLSGACEALATPRPLGPLLDMAAGLGSEIESLVAGGAVREQVFAAFAAAIGRTRPPTVVIIEDVHWADAATLDLLRFVGRRMQRVEAMIVLTWRADEVGADHPLHRVLGELPLPATHRINLQPLSLAAVASLAGRTADASTVFALTGGNAFLVTEMLREHGDGVPPSVRESILARRARLPAETRHVVDLVSVVPARAELELVKAGTPAVADVVTPAVEIGLLTFDGRTLGFRHELARLAVLESLPLLRVQTLHRAILTALARSADRPGVLARLVHHAVGAGDRESVQRYAPAAARQAAALGAHREAAAHYRAAIAWADGQEACIRADTIDLLAYECYLTGDIRAAVDAHTEALAAWRELRNTIAIGRDLRWLSRLAWFQGDHDTARQRAQEALDVLSPLGEDEELAMALSNRAQLHMLAHEHQSCIVLGARATEMARQLGSVEVLSHALNNVGTARVHTGDLSGRQLQEESLDLALHHNLHEHAARAFTNLSYSSIDMRDYPYARRWLDPGINYAVERDLDSWRLYMLAARARLYLETGRWADAEIDAAFVIDNPRTTAVAKIPALAALGLLRARQRGEGGALLDEALTLALPTAEKQRIVPVRAARAELALWQGRVEAVRTEAEAGLALLQHSGATWEREQLRYLLWCAGGRPHPTPVPDGPRGLDGPHGLSMRGEWRAAADAWERLGCPFQRADALASGDVAAKEEAFQAFLALGATPAADRVRQELREAGVTRVRRGPRESTRAHPAGLTRRESEILQLLGQHLSNSTIGERLFVSPKTVEHHVSAILGKLGVATRDEAVVEARGRGWLTP